MNFENRKNSEKEKEIQKNKEKKNDHTFTLSGRRS